jgi:hypothetical protein
MTCRPMFCEGRADCGDRHCPGHPVNSDEELTRRLQEAELRWQCRDQMDARQLYEHERAGELMPVGDRHAGIVGYAPADLDGLGVEAADAPRVTGAVPPIIVDDIKPAPLFAPLGKRKPLPPTDWPAITRWGAAVAVCIVWTLIVIYRK